MVSILRSSLLTLACACSFLVAGCAAISALQVAAVVTDATVEPGRIDAVLGQYCQYLVKGQFAEAAALFDEEAEILVEPRPALPGREAIQSFLTSSFSGTLVSLSFISASTTARGNGASQQGTYRQVIMNADGTASVTAGTYKSEWSRKIAGPWRIHRMHVVPGQGAGNG